MDTINFSTELRPLESHKTRLFFRNIKFTEETAVSAFFSRLRLFNIVCSNSWAKFENYTFDLLINVGTGNKVQLSWLQAGKLSLTTLLSEVVSIGSKSYDVEVTLESCVSTTVVQQISRALE